MFTKRVSRARPERGAGELLAESGGAGGVLRQAVEGDVEQLTVARQAADVVRRLAVLAEHDRAAVALGGDVVREVEDVSAHGRLVAAGERRRARVVRPHLAVAVAVAAGVVLRDRSPPAPPPWVDVK